MPECFVNLCLALSTRPPLWMSYLSAKKKKKRSQLIHRYGDLVYLENWESKGMPYNHFFDGVCCASPPNKGMLSEQEEGCQSLWGLCFGLPRRLKRLGHPSFNLQRLTPHPHLLSAGPVCSCKHGGRLWPPQQSGLSPYVHDTQTYSLPIPWVWMPWSHQLSAQAGTC